MQRLHKEVDKIMNKPLDAWNIQKCPKTKKLIGYWNTGKLNHSGDKCPRCGDKHFA